MPPVKSSPFDILRKMPFTIVTIAINTILFAVAWQLAGTLEGQRWSAALLRVGAQFNPLTLDKEWYRVITYLFLHGSIPQLIVNISAMFYAGVAIERRVGTAKFAFVFFLSGIAAALSSLYWNLFTVGIGMSGAIAGLFGFFLMRNIFLKGRHAKPMLILVAVFALFASANLLFPEALYADYAAQYGGFVMGVMIGLVSFASGRHTRLAGVRVEYAMMAFLIVMFLMMPGYQVRYFKLFQQMVAAEDTTRYLLKDKLTDDDMRTFIRNYHHWEDVEAKLVSQKGLPADLAPDTFKLRQYIALRKQENLLKKLVVQREAYAYLDSVERLQQIMRRFMNLEYGLWSRIRPGPPEDSILQSRMIRVLYDSNWVEMVQSPAAYYRVGIRDSLGRWNGPFREYDGSGRLRVKGSYRRNKRDGVFLYYSDEGKCVEAGRFLDDRRFGKWQTFHGNGRVASETLHNNGVFVSAVWDPFGNQLVVDGNGREIQLHPNGVVAVSGEYRHGRKEGVWYGWYDTGEMHFEETFNQGRLVAGKSRSPDGQTFVYDESSLYPLPEGGAARYQAYLKDAVKKLKLDQLGHVKLSFRVTARGTIADVSVDQGATKELEAKAIEIVTNGPRWLPAREHGYKRVESRAEVQVNFY